jgi:hypothetical protein
MKYIKIYEELMSENDVQNLYNCLIELFTKLGLTHINYSDYNRLALINDLEFFDDDNYIFAFKLSNTVGYTSSNTLTSLLYYRKSNNKNHEIMNFVPEYLKNINGLKYLGRYVT